MTGYRKMVRDSVRGILANEDSGLNARIAGLAAVYGLEALQIDFSEYSDTFVQSALAVDTDNFQFSALFPKPLGLALYTVGAINTKDQNSGLFSGQVEVRLDFYFQFSARLRPGMDAIEDRDTETIVDMVEEAVLLSLHDAAAAWGQVVYNFDFQSLRGPMRPDDDGWQQRVSITLMCGVHV